MILHVTIHHRTPKNHAVVDRPFPHVARGVQFGGETRLDRPGPSLTYALACSHAGSLCGDEMCIGATIVWLLLLLPDLLCRYALSLTTDPCDPPSPNDVWADGCLVLRHLAALMNNARAVRVFTERHDLYNSADHMRYMTSSQ